MACAPAQELLTRVLPKKKKNYNSLAVLKLFFYRKDIPPLSYRLPSLGQCFLNSIPHCKMKSAYVPHKPLNWCSGHPPGPAGYTIWIFTSWEVPRTHIFNSCSDCTQGKHNHFSSKAHVYPCLWGRTQLQERSTLHTLWKYPTDWASQDVNATEMQFLGPDFT